jgi:hypothetical protein
MTGAGARQHPAPVERAFMNVPHTAVSGLVGTIAMFGVIYVLPLAFGRPPLYIPLFVGSLISSRPRVAGLLGTGILLFNGAVIACLGRLIWRFGPGARGLLEGLAFGAVLGLLSIVVMKVLLAHPKATETRPTPQTLVAFILWVGHLAYGVCVALVSAAW